MATRKKSGRKYGKAAGKACRARDEEAKEGNVAAGAWWKGRQGEEQEAGDRDRTFGGAKEGREGSIEAEIERRTQENERTQEDRRSEEAGIEAEVDRHALGQLERTAQERSELMYAQGRDGDAAALGTSEIASTLQGCADEPLNTTLATTRTFARDLQRWPSQSCCSSVRRCPIHRTAVPPFARTTCCGCSRATTM